jgi:hypothetical protein
MRMTRKLLATTLLWVIVVSTPSGPVTTGHFSSQANCQGFLATVVGAASNPFTQRQVNSLSNFHVNGKGLNALVGQSSCAEKSQ